MQPTYKAPVDRTVLDKTRKPVMLITGLLLLGYTSSSTVIGVHEDLSKIHGDPLAWLAGFLLALAVFIIQIYTGEDRSLWGLYAVAFVPDLHYSNRYLYRFIYPLLEGMQPHQLAVGITLAITLPLGTLAAIYGERLIFGPRRKASKQDANRNTSNSGDEHATSSADRSNDPLHSVTGRNTRHATESKVTDRRWPGDTGRS